MNNIEDLNKIIERAKRQLEQMIDLAPQGMLLLDRDGTVVRTNRRLLKLLGFSNFGDVLGRRLEEIFPGEGRDDDRGAGNAFPDTLAEDWKGFKTWETDIQLGDDRMHTIRFLVMGTAGNIGFSVAIVDDVTGEKELAANLERKQKKQAVKALTGALMHNINQPLTVIMVRIQLMELELMKKQGVPDEIRMSFKDIRKNAMIIAKILSRAEKLKDFVAEEYLGDTKILKIQGIDKLLEKAGASASPWLDSLEVAYATVLEGLITLLEAHEPGSLIHAKRTSGYVVHLAKLMGKNTAEISVLKRCAFLHDVGKLGISDRILKKPSRLDPEEMKEMERHPEIGYRLLSHFPFLNEEAEIAYSHHEWYDGTGYPRGLAGKDIPLGARLIAVADAFDILRFGRPYRPAISLKSSVKEINAGRGTQFDPEVVKVFNTCHKEFDSLFSNTADKTTPV